MNNMFRKYNNLFFLLMVIIICPLECYTSVLLDTDLISYKTYNGLDVLSNDSFCILSIYILCVFIQYLISNSEKNYFVGVISNCLLVCKMFLFPLNMYGTTLILKSFKEFFVGSFGYGFYLAIIFIILSTIIDIKSLVLLKKGGNL